MSNLIEWLGALRSLGFGAMLGGGIGLIIGLSLRWQDPEREVAVETFTTAGALTGAGLHLFIEQWVARTVIAPFARFTCYYSRLVQVHCLYCLRTKNPRGIGPTTDKLKNIIETLSENYFLHGKCP